MNRRACANRNQMNNSSPFVPTSSGPEQKNASRRHLRVAVFCILSVHVAGLMALLLTNGCRRQEPEPIPAPETNLFAESSGLEMPMNTVEPETPTNPVVPEADTNFAPMLPGPGQEPAPIQQQPIAPEFTTPAPTMGQEYTIIKGDTLSGIADKFPGVSVKMLQEANPAVQPTKLRIGQKIVIPPAAPSPITSGITPLPDSSNGGTVYTVKAGDTLSKIAKNQGTTVKALRAENNLRTDMIRVGQKLRIPAKNTTPLPAGSTGEGAPSLSTPGY